MHTGMRNMKCYGRKKIIVPKEKAFILNFFDGNESSNMSPKKYMFSSDDEDQEDGNSHDNKENIHSSVKSPALFKEDFSLMQEKDFAKTSFAKPKQALNHRYARGNNCVRKKVKGIQHLSTKYCKAHQPCWDEFEKYDLTIERPRKSSHSINTELQRNINSSSRFKNTKQCTQTLSCASTTNNKKYEEVDPTVASSSKTGISSKEIKTSKARINSYSPSETLESSHSINTELQRNINSSSRFKNTKQCTQTLSCASTTNNKKYEEVDPTVASSSKTGISSKEIKTSKARMNSYSPSETLESSSELFSKIPKSKSSVKKKIIEKKSSRKKHLNAPSYNKTSKLEKKINHCMQNIDFSETSNKNSISNSKSCKENATFQAKKMQRKSNQSTTAALVPGIKTTHKSSDIYDIFSAVLSDFENMDLVSTSKIHNVCSNTEISQAPHKHPHNDINNFERIQCIDKKLPILPSVCTEVNSHFSNDNLLARKPEDLCKDENQNMQKSAKLLNKLQDESLKDSWKISSQSKTIPHVGSSASCSLMTEKISNKPADINKNIPRCISKSMNTHDTLAAVIADLENLDLVSVLKNHDVCSNKFNSDDLPHKNPHNNINNFKHIQCSDKKLPILADTRAEINNHFHNADVSASKLDDLHECEIDDMPKSATLHSKLKDKNLKKLSQSKIILHSGDSTPLCSLATENISDKPADIIKNATVLADIKNLNSVSVSQIHDVCSSDRNSEEPPHNNPLNKINNFESIPNCIHPELIQERKTENSIMSNKPQILEKKYAISLNKNIDSLNLKRGRSFNSKINGSSAHNLSLNLSGIIQNYNSLEKNFSGKFTTSTPVTNRKKIHAAINIETIVLSEDEIIDSKTHCYEKVSKSKNFKSFKTKQPKDSFIDCLNRSASVEILKSFQLGMSPDLSKSKKSCTVPNKNPIKPVSLKKSQSSLNISSANPLPEKDNLDDFTRIQLLKLCGQDFVIPFADSYNWKDFKVKKIGEGTYGEVFMLSKGKISSVLKVIAISEDPNVKSLQGLSSVYSEIKISKSLSELRCHEMNQSKNFVKVMRSSVVSGSYPVELMKAWDDFSNVKSTYNDRPDVYSENQLFAILELGYGGKDMSCITLRNAVEAEIILKQIAVSLAVAEEQFSFEHRDLHIGNILVKRNRAKKVSYKLRGKDISFQCLGLQVTIIDFTLSLLSEKGYIYYYDLADDSLFDQTGDYQFDVYKSMRRHLENKWEECSLYSNILWLKYLCKKMKDFKYTHSTAVTHKRGLKAIDSFNTQLTKCSCALECLEKCGITKTIFKRTNFETSRNSILVSRNSIQKSKLSICN